MSISTPFRRAAVALLFVLLPAAPAAAQSPCSGFTDVFSSNSFCTNVTWLKNRAITLGCSSPTLFCPADGVVRLSMAAFMNRLGNVLAPIQLATSQSAPSDLDLDNPQVICATGPVAITGVQRQLQINGSLQVGPSTGTADVSGTLVISTNGGTVWTPVSGKTTSTTRGPGASTASLSVFDTTLITTATAPRYGLRVSRPPSSLATGASGPWQCTLAFEAVNFNLLNNQPDE